MTLVLRDLGVGSFALEADMGPSLDTKPLSPGCDIPRHLRARSDSEAYGNVGSFSFSVTEKKMAQARRQVFVS